MRLGNRTRSWCRVVAAILVCCLTLGQSASADRAVYAVGINDWGQLGVGNTTSRSTLVQVQGYDGLGFLTDVIAVSAGTFHSLAVKSDGTVWGWGYTNLLGSGIWGMDANTPILIPGVGGGGVPSDVIAVSAGDNHSLALKSDGTVWAWGFGQFGELGIGTNVPEYTEVVQVLGQGGEGFLTDVVAVSAGMNVSLALKTDGTVWAWGWGANGQIGNGSSSNQYTPVQVRGPGGEGILTNVVAVSAGGLHSLALKSDGTVWAWGYGYYGQLGDGTFHTSSPEGVAAPVQVLGPEGVGVLTDVVAVDAGYQHSVAVKSDGTVWAWGYGNSGRLGNGSTTHQSTPVQVLGVGGVGVLTDVVSVSAGFGHSLAVKSDGTVWGWGNGWYGSGPSSNWLAANRVLGVGGVGVLTGRYVVSAGVYHSLFCNTNRAPGSNAGPDQEVTASHGGSPLTDMGTFTLDGSASSDPDNDTLTYEWTERRTVIGTSASLDLTRESGIYFFELRVTDSYGEYTDSDVIVVVDEAPNGAPTADAGPDQTVLSDEGVFLRLDGRASSDPDGDALTYAWSEGGVDFAYGNHPYMYFEPGIHIITLTVTDTYGASDTSEVIVTVASNTPPTSDAGPDQSVTASHGGNPATDTGAFTLDGTGSSDPDGDTLTYEWTEGSTVVGTTATLALTRGAGTHTFTLRVTDPDGEYDEDEVVVTVNAASNRTPTANAGPDQTISSKVRVLVSLNGSSSSDPDGDGLTYAWSEGSVNIASGRTPSAYFLPGTHNVKLTVTDTYGGTSEDYVQIFVDSRTVTTVKMQASIATRRGVALRMGVRLASNVTLIGKTLSYYVDNVLIGTVTSANPAYVTYTPSSSMSLGAHALKVRFEGDTTHQPSEATSTLTVKR